MSDETPRERYARSALIGLLASNVVPAPRSVRNIASLAFCFADAMIAAEGQPYCTCCGSASDLIGRTKGGILIHICETCAGLEKTA